MLVPQPETAPFCHFVTFPPTGGITLGGSDDALCRHSLPPRRFAILPYDRINFLFIKFAREVDKRPPLRVNFYLIKIYGMMG